MRNAAIYLEAGQCCHISRHICILGWTLCRVQGEHQRSWDMGTGYLVLNGWGIYHLMGGAFMAFGWGIYNLMCGAFMVYWVGHLSLNGQNIYHLMSRAL